jgi:glycosyltransferase 2 family protein
MSPTGAVAGADEVWPQPTPSRGRLSRLIKPAVTLLLYAIIFYRIDTRELFARLSTARFGYVAAGVALYAAGQLLCAWKWQILLAPVALTARYTQLAAFYFIGMFFNIFLPTIVGGDAVKAVLLARATQEPARATMTVFMEWNLGPLALLSIATVAAWRAPTVHLLGFSLLVWTVVLLTGFVVVNIALINVRAYRLVDRLLARTALAALRPHAESLYLAIVPYTRAGGALAGGIFLSFVFQAVVILVVFLNVRALGHAFPMSALAVIVPLVSLAGMLPLSVNGLGVRDALYIVLFGQLGASESLALSLALLYFAVTMTASLPGGVIYALGRTEALSHVRRP